MDRFNYEIEMDIDAPDPRESDFYSQSEIDAWKAGNCFGFVITCEGFGVVDSCWGFYDYPFCEESAKRAMESIDKASIMKQIRERIEGLEDILFELEEEV